MGPIARYIAEVGRNNSTHCIGHIRKQATDGLQGCRLQRAAIRRRQHRRTLQMAARIGIRPRDHRQRPSRGLHGLARQQIVNEIEPVAAALDLFGRIEISSDIRCRLLF